VGWCLEKRNLLGTQARSTVLPGPLEVLESGAVALVHRGSMEIGRRMTLGRVGVDDFRTRTRVVLSAVPWGNHLRIKESTIEK